MVYFWLPFSRGEKAHACPGTGRPDRTARYARGGTGGRARLTGIRRQVEEACRIEPADTGASVRRPGSGDESTIRARCMDTSRRSIVADACPGEVPGPRRARTASPAERPAGPRVALVDPGDFTPPYDEALAAGLAANGCRVRLWGQAGRPPVDPSITKEGHFYRAVAGPLGRRLPRALLPVVKGLGHAADLARLATALAADGTEIVHLQWAPLPLLDRRLVARLTGRTPVILTVHDTRPYNGSRGGPVLWGLEGLLGAVDALIVHTEEARERLVAAGHAPARVHAIPHGLLALGAPAPPPPRPPRPGERPLELLMFGAIKPYKGVDLVLEALARLEPARRARLKVTIAGRVFMDLEPFRRLIESAGLGNVVELRPGYVPDAEVAALIAGSDALLLPYRLIDASGVAMAAVAAARPVVASAIPSFAELFGGGRGALLVPPEDVEALAAALGSLADAPERLVALGRAMADLRDGFPSWAEIGRRTLAVYDQARPRIEAGR
jgi:glycosyltransferase involved in cell wall biosynthesis